MTIAEALASTDVADLAARIQQIPAPTFSEATRAADQRAYRHRFPVLVRPHAAA